MMYPGAMRDDQQPLATARLYLAAWMAMPKGHVISFGEENVQIACTRMGDLVELAVRDTRLAESSV